MRYHRRLWLVLGFVLLLGGMGRLAGCAFAEEPPPPGARVMLSGGPPTPREAARARQHHRQALRLLVLGVVWPVLVLGGFLLLGGTRWLGRVVAVCGDCWALAALAVAGIVALGMMLLTLPLDYYAGYVFEHQYGLSNQTALQWLRDYLVSNAVNLVILLPLALLGYWLLRVAPRAWPWWLAAAAVPLSIFLVVIQPVFIAPLFNTFTPLRDEALRRDILAMANAQGIKGADIFQVDASRQSNAVNAYVNGFGPTHRIVLYDTLLKDFTPEEIKFVMAHEMGHYVLGHILKGIVLSVLGVLVAGLALQGVGGWLLTRHGAFFGADALGNPEVLPLLLLLGILLGILGTPVSSALSRKMEAQADQFATRVYGHPSAGISAFHKLARLNISLEDPPWWEEVLFYTHPSIQHRIEALQQAGGQENR